MKSFWCFLLSLYLVLFVVSCNRDHNVAKGDDRVLLGAPIGKPADEPPVLRFDLKALPVVGDSAATRHAYECKYQARGKTAIFRLELNYGALQREGKDDFPVAHADGKFAAVSGSENAVLLEGLKAALLAKNLPIDSKRVRELPFDAVVLGENQSEIAGGGFADKPAGKWTVIKLFFPVGGDEAEVFLNINPTLGKGEFSMKDEDYGDYLLKEFAKVL